MSKKGIETYESNRCEQAARVLRMAFKLSRRWYSCAEFLGIQVNTHNNAPAKKFYRDLRTLEKAGVPVQQDGVRYRVDPDFIKRFM